MVGVPASRAGPPDNGGSLFIYPSRHDRSSSIHWKELFDSADVGGFKPQRPPGIVAGTSDASRRASTSIGREEVEVDGSKRISDVSLDNCGDRLYFVYSKRARRGGFTLPLPPPPLHRRYFARPRENRASNSSSRRGGACTREVEVESELGNLSLAGERNIWLQG